MQLQMKIEINKKDGKWLINGKKYADLSEEEKKFFDEFIIAMKWQFECEQNDKQTKTIS
jgi:hypothetical protein